MLDVGENQAALVRFVLQCPFKEWKRIMSVPANGVAFDRNHELGIESPFFRQTNDVFDIGSLLHSGRSEPIDELLF